MQLKYTKLLMAISGLTMIAFGIVITFLTNEIIAFLGYSANTFILFQVIGAFYFAFGMFNWQAKANLIGGIYSKPVAMSNFLHFFIVSISLLKSIDYSSKLALSATILYLVFATFFGYILFTNPRNTE